MTIVSLGGVEWGGTGEASRSVVRGCWFVAGPSTTNQTDSTREGPGLGRAENRGSDVGRGCIPGGIGKQPASHARLAYKIQGGYGLDRI